MFYLVAKGYYLFNSKASSEALSGCLGFKVRVVHFKVRQVNQELCDGTNG